ncbi:unnamed protein product [Amoebophrya sp. A25]|nr:unnamed protein product [Amoebophrya sp. A25]|eukprot:GSA25T00001127001.1
MLMSGFQPPERRPLQTTMLPQFQFGGESLALRVMYGGNLGKFLAEVPLFKSMSPADLSQLAQNMEIKTYQPGTPIFSLGDLGDCFYVVLQGEAEVRVPDQTWLKVGQEAQLAVPTKIAGQVYPKGTKGVVDKYEGKRGYPYTFRTQDNMRGRVAEHELGPIDGAPPHAEKFIALLRPGDYVGEQAILKSAYRNATVKAYVPKDGKPAKSLVCGVLTKAAFVAMDLNHKLVFPRRKAVLAIDDAFESRMGEEKLQAMSTKTAEEAEFVRQAIKNNKVIHDLIELTPEHIDAMVRVAYKQNVAAKEVLIREGDLFATQFYIVASGAFEFSIAAKNGSEHDKLFQHQMMRQCKPGGSFGEIALMYHCQREATATCTEAATVWVVDRIAFKNILYTTRRKQLLQYVDIIGSIPQFNCLLNDEREAFAEALFEKHFIAGEYIIREQELSTMFTVLVSGEVEIDGKRYNTTENPGFFFGEESLLRGSVSQHSVKCISDDVVVACLSKHDFERLLGPLEDLMAASKQAGKPRRSKVELVDHPKSATLDIKMNDLKRIGMLGCGGFGAVSLEQHAKTGQCFALKQMSKAYVVKCKMQKSIMNEKNIQLMCNSPFIVKLYQTFNLPAHLCLLLEPVLGGELYHTYHKRKMHGDSTRARFYAATTVKAFAHLHEKQVIFRDLKPENLLLDHEGRCKLTDMGLAKQTAIKTFTTCGTPDYFAPEIIDRKGHHAGVDWWTLGVLVHELMSGHAPFEASQPAQIYAKVRRGVNQVMFPYKESDPGAVEMVKGLLKNEPQERLPMLPGGVDNIRSHSWYQNAKFSWPEFEANKMKVPYKPDVKGPTDLSNFKCRTEADMPKHFNMDYKDPGDGWDKDF